MSFLFGETKRDKQIREREGGGGREREEREQKRKQERKEMEELENILMTKLKAVYPEMDIDFLIKLKGTAPLKDGDNEESLLELYSLEKLNYSQFIAFKYFCGNGDFFTHREHYIDRVGELNEINPQIFINNVNIYWKLLQLAKKDTSIHIPPSPPNAPPLPSPPKRSSPKKSKSKLTNETLQMAKSKLKPKGPPNPPPLPSPPKRSSPKKSKSKLTKEGLEMAKSKLKPKGPPNPPLLPSPPKRSSPKKSKSKLTKEGLEMAKSKLKRYIDPKSDNYDLEMAFKNLEK
jgi:hypothetical protein